MSKKKAAAEQAATTAAPQSAEGFDVGASAPAATEQPPVELGANDAGDPSEAEKLAAAKEKPKTGDVVAQQIDQRTQSEMEQAPQHGEVDPVALAMKEVDAMIEECSNHMEGHELLKKFEAVRPGTKLERRIKEAAMQRVREYICAVQNGTPPPKIEANEIAALPGLQTAGIQAERVELRSRSDRDIAGLLEDNEKLRQQLAAQQAV